MTTSTKSPSKKRQTDLERLERMEQAVCALYDSEGWERWIKTRRRFHRYSFGNTLLIAMQCPHATHVTGFRGWQHLNRQVRKGEKAIWIWAPRTAKIETEGDDGETATQRRTFFVQAPVFDISQTDGEALPEISIPVTSADHAEDLRLLIAWAQADLGYSVTIEAIRGTARGYCNRGAKRIVIDATLAIDAQLSVLIHEVGHALGIGYDNYSREDAEVIVEATTYLVAGTLGLDTSSSSLGYIAAWSRGQKPAALRDHAKVIDAIARQIEAAVSEPADDALAVIEQVAVAA